MASVDIVIPNYNYGRYLRACVLSVLSQDVENLRVLIIDNGSSDKSAEIAADLARQDKRIELVLRDRNLGPHASFNEGIDWARADYFLILFSDDFLVEGALRRATDLMEKDRSISFTYGRDVAICNDDPAPDIAPQPAQPAYRLEEGRAFIERFCRMGVFQIPGSTVVVRTAIQKRVGHYRAELSHSDDYEVWLRLAQHGRVGALDCIQAGVRTHEENRSHKLAARQVQHIRHTMDAAESFFAHEGAAMPGSGRLLHLARRGAAERAYWSGVAHLLRRQEGARELFGLAFRLYPLMAVLPPLGYLLQRPDALKRFAVR